MTFFWPRGKNFDEFFHRNLNKLYLLKDFEHLVKLLRKTKE